MYSPNVGSIYQILGILLANPASEGFTAHSQCTGTHLDLYVAYWIHPANNWQNMANKK